MYVYNETESFIEDGERRHVYTVGFYKPDGGFESDSDYPSKHQARERVNYLNGGTGLLEDQISQLAIDIGNYLARQ